MASSQQLLLQNLNNTFLCEKQGQGSSSAADNLTGTDMIAPSSPSSLFFNMHLIPPNTVLSNNVNSLGNILSFNNNNLNNSSTSAMGFGQQSPPSPPTTFQDALDDFIFFRCVFFFILLLLLLLLLFFKSRVTVLPRVFVTLKIVTPFQKENG
jgi:hypothetical protein